MKKVLYIFFILFALSDSFACDCDVPKPIVEFQSATLVFEGNVISKIYASDSLTFTITFDIFKHYKQGPSPKTLEFAFASEGEFTGDYSSCDWKINKGEKWIVYAYYQNEKLTFSYYCSNSRRISKNGISNKSQQLLDNANKFDIDNYTFTRYFDGPNSFTDSKPKSNLDSLLFPFHSKEYGDEYKDKIAKFVIDIDKNGNLIAANLMETEHKDPRFNRVIDTIFNLNKPENIELRKPKSVFENDMHQILNRLNQWDITYIKGTDIPISIRKFIQFYKKEKEISVSF